jgi:hypothetical protein
MNRASLPPIPIIILTVILLPFAILDLAGDIFLFNQLSFYYYLPIVVLNIMQVYSFLGIWRLRKSGFFIYISCYVAKYLMYYLAGAKITNVAFIFFEPLIISIAFISVRKKLITVGQ